jgi:hypothetical protein
MIKLFKQLRQKSARMLIVATLFAVSVMVGVPTLASAAAPPYIPSAGFMSVHLGTGIHCLTVNSISFNAYDKLYSSACIFKWGEQQWKFNRLGNGYFSIKSQFNGECLDVYDYNQANNARVVTYPCIDGATNQQWSLKYDYVTDGLKVRARHSGKCLDALGSPWITQFYCGGFSSESWHIQS